MRSEFSIPLTEASQWYALLASDDVAENDRQAWKIWIESKPENAQAWRQIETVNRKFSTVTDALGYENVHLPNPARRKAMKHIIAIGTVSLLSVQTYRMQPWQGVFADVTTKVGQQDRMQLQDGTSLYINTDSAVNVVYSDSLRLIELIKGEIHIQTAHESFNRPFKVKTKHGYITALGTRFNVRDYGKFTQVSLFEGQLRIEPNKDASLKTVIESGQSIRFDSEVLNSPSEVKFLDESWIKGKLIFNEVPLEQVVKELARYRSGVLRCSPKVAQLKISGVLPSNDIEEALRLLTKSFPLQIDQFTSYWTTVSALS